MPLILCKDCVYFIKSNDARGSCHRHPPRWRVETSQGAEYLQPRVFPSEGCGDGELTAEVLGQRMRDAMVPQATAVRDGERKPESK